MNVSTLLKQLDDTLGPKAVDMTSAQFEAYATDQVAKAKKDMDEDDKEKKSKAKKRLEHLRGVAEMVSKSSWEGTNGTLSIPVYEGGYEDTTAKKELTDTTTALTSNQGNIGTASSGQSFFSNESEIGKMLQTLKAEVATIGKAAEPPAPAAPAPVTKGADDIAWPTDVANREFLAKGEISAPEWGTDSAGVK